MFNRQLEYLKEQRRATEGIRLQQGLKDILKELRSRYRVPYQKTIQKNESLYETEEEARSINSYRATSYTFKFFYILSIIIFGFFLHCLDDQMKNQRRTERMYLLEFGCIASFLIGLFPLKNVIYLPRPTKSICDTCDRIESLIWKKDISHEDIIEMKKLRNYGNLLIFLSELSKILNFVFIFTVLYVSTSIDLNIHSRSVIDLLFFTSIFMIPVVAAILTKILCLRVIIEKQYSPELIRLFL